jgi:hypothetical protein
MHYATDRPQSSVVETLFSNAMFLHHQTNIRKQVLILVNLCVDAPWSPMHHLHLIRMSLTMSSPRENEIRGQALGNPRRRAVLCLAQLDSHHLLKTPYHLYNKL